MLVLFIKIDILRNASAMSNGIITKETFVIIFFLNTHVPIPSSYSYLHDFHHDTSYVTGFKLGLMHL